MAWSWKRWLCLNVSTESLRLLPRPINKWLSGVYLAFGGILLIIGGVLEWIVGATFNYIVFMTYGAFWLTLYFTLEPSQSAFTMYASNPDAGAAAIAEGLNSTGFNASFGKSRTLSEAVKR
jgi:succinate-acetate transporter protein